MILAAAVMLLAALLLVSRGLAMKDTRALFSSTDASLGNSFTAAVSFDAYPPMEISSILASPLCTSASVTWDTDRPANSVVEWSATPGGPYSSYVDATLVTSHTVILNGLSAGTWYLRVSSTDIGGQTTVSPEASFTTQTGGKPALSLSKNRTYWFSYSEYLGDELSVEYRISNAGPAAYNVQVVGTINTNDAVDISATDIPYIPAGSSGLLTIKYLIVQGTNGFISHIYATANDVCGDTYSYPGPWMGD